MDTMDYSDPAASKTAEMAVVVDIWRYTGLLAAILLAIGAVLARSLVVSALTAAICIVGGALITYITHIEFDSARRDARAPRIGRIFG